jgi:catechol 2,3-dioxygenase-like lactoylglutathione lyase family enzyme
VSAAPAADDQIVCFFTNGLLHLAGAEKPSPLEFSAISMMSRCVTMTQPYNKIDQVRTRRLFVVDDTPGLGPNDFGAPSVVQPDTGNDGTAANLLPDLTCDLTSGRNKEVNRSNSNKKWMAGMIGRTVAALALVGLMASATVAVAQTPPGFAPAGEVAGAGNFIHMVGDMERTVGFYTILLGVQANDEARNFPYFRDFKAIPGVDVMYNVPGSKFKNTTFTVSNSDLVLEFFQWSGERPPVESRPFDLGVPTILMQVRNIDAVIDAVKKYGGSFVTPNGVPVRFGNRQVLMVRDPDGYCIYVTALDSPPPAREPGNSIGATLRLTAADANQTAHFFETVFGFKVYEAAELTDDPLMGRAMGLNTLKQRWAGSTVPGSSLPIQFAEYDKLGGKKVDQALPRPGTAMLRMKVRNFDASLAKAMTAGATMAPGNKAPTVLGNNTRIVVIVTPDGQLLQLAEEAPMTKTPAVDAAPAAAPKK